MFYNYNNDMNLINVIIIKIFIFSPNLIFINSLNKYIKIKNVLII